MQTERFAQERKQVLENVFNIRAITNIWRKIVKNQLRSADIKDLFDNYDFNYNIDNHAKHLRKRILSGTYRTEQPVFYRIEKKLGVCRLLVIPNPSDALVLQVVIESIARQVLDAQPTDRAFFSRDRHNVPRSYQIDNYELSFREQWKMLQQHIYKFSDECKYLVVTDISNFYDSITVSELRKVLLSHTQINEVLVDLIFNIISGISWTPDYLPYAGKGLPVSNIEGIRLLAHSMLYEIDRMLNKKTQGSFVRWMDDIVIGVNKYKDGKNIIFAVSEMLRSRGLALNLSKTEIYDCYQGISEFEIEENKYIDRISKEYADSGNNQVLPGVYKRFKKHLKKNRTRYWDKVTKRYITFFANSKYANPLQLIAKLYLEDVNLRPNLLWYLEAIGYCKKSKDVILDILGNIDVFDSISLFQISNLLTNWQITTSGKDRVFIERVEERLLSFPFNEQMPMNFYSILWFKAKYNGGQALLDILKKYHNLWNGNDFLRRQAVASLSRLWVVAPDYVSKVLDVQIASNISGASSIAGSILMFAEAKSIESKVNMYLFNPKATGAFSLQKFLVLCSFMNSKTIRKNSNTWEKIDCFIKDQYYLKILKDTYK
ncbi:MAG: RNA-directed DNA polymerase [Candidatus Cloacimonadaceae bacterium]